MAFECRSCGERLPLAEGSGRPRAYCNRACQQRAYRRRHANRTVPPVMAREPRWVRFDAQKRPLRAHDGGPASVTDPSTWTTYREALASDVGEGVGLVLGNGIGCLDLDDAIDDHGVIADWARLLIAQHRADAYMIETSRSGHGIHIFTPMPEARGRRIRTGGIKLEVYSRDRFIAITGNRLKL